MFCFYKLIITFRNDLDFKAFDCAPFDYKQKHLQQYFTAGV